jgi:hypothetical protein
MALRMITTSKVVFRQIMTFDVLFDVVMVCMVFGVLFGFRRSDFRSSDYSPQICTGTLQPIKTGFILMLFVILRFRTIKYSTKLFLEENYLVVEHYN